MSLTLREIVQDIAKRIELVDARRLVAKSARSDHMYQPSIGPHTESETLGLVFEELCEFKSSVYGGRF